MKEVIILAGGFGTRLSGIIEDKPKTLALINGKPFLELLIDSLQKFKIDRFIFALGYKSSEVIEFLESKYKSIEKIYSIEETPLLTGGAIRQASEFINSESFLVINGDTYHGIDVNELYLTHQNNEADVTISLKMMYNFNRYGSVLINDEARIVDFKEKEFQLKGYINTGYIIFRKSILNSFEQNVPFSLERDLLIPEINKLKIISLADDSYFIDIGVPEDFRRANAEFAQIK